jgi:putative RecB family exonuclease
LKGNPLLIMPTYSHSRLSAYENCPLKYRYAYVDRVKLERMPESIEAFMGKRVHETLEKLYSDRMISKEDTLDGLLEFYDRAWGKNWSDDVQIVRKDVTAENYHETGRRCIADYFKRYAPFSQGRTLKLEAPVYITIDGYKLMGYIDRLDFLGDGRYEIHDYKTSRSLPEQQYFDDDRQLALYQIGINNMWKDAENVDLVWHYLVFDREMRSCRSPECLEKVKAGVVGVIRRIEAAEKEYDFPASESALCNWCEYRSLCPTCKHETTVEKLPANEFLNDDGVKLVNEYARLYDEKKELTERIDSRLELLREAIVAFAKRENVEAIRGSDRKMKVKIETKPKFPAKGDDEREALELLLKSAGAWDDLSTLDTFALVRALKGKKLDPALVSNLREFMTTEESCRITLSVLKGDEE